MTLDDAILATTGGPTVPDGLLAYYQANGATSNSLQDAEREWLAIGTTNEGTNQDMWFAFLRQSGYEGALPDMLLEFWTPIVGP